MLQVDGVLQVQIIEVYVPDSLYSASQRFGIGRNLVAQDFEPEKALGRRGSRLAGKLLCAVDPDFNPFHGYA
jgi:hypothetical protein